MSKVSFFNKNLRKSFWGILATLSTLCSLLLSFVPLPCLWKIGGGIALIVFLPITYIGLWYRANHLSRIRLRIDKSYINIEFGDLFKCDGLKVIAFNECFDTQVDDIIISRSSLNGKYIEEHCKDLENLKKEISTNKHLKECLVSKKDQTHWYRLGTILPYENYLLLAFSKFTKDNRAVLTSQELCSCLVNFWEELDICYNGRNVFLPLLGSGITRFEKPLTEQELLEFILLTFKISNLQFSHDCGITIVLHISMREKINLYRLQEIFDGL